MPVPTWRLAAAAAAGAVVVFAVPLGSAVLRLLVVNAVLVLAALGDWLLAPGPARLDVTRSAPEIMILGDTGRVTWRVGNPTGRGVRLRLADALPPSLGAERRRAALTVGAGGAASASTAVRPSRRGRIRLTGVTVRAEGPLGLAARQGDVALAGAVRVYPPFRSRKDAELRLHRSYLLQAGLRPAERRGGGTEFDSLREYTVDDESRRIDWSATARAGKPIVRTYRTERSQVVIALLDTGRTMAAVVPAGARDTESHELVIPRLDHALDAVMALTAVATGLGDRAGLVAFADRVRAVVPPNQRAGQLARVTGALYTLEPLLVESDYAAAFAQTLTRFRRRALLVVLTELAEQAAEETLVPSLPLVARDHLVVVAAARDPNVQAWARAVPEQAGAAYRKAAAIRALSERRRLVARLRGLGAVVVDADPGRLGPAVVDAYLDAKAAGRL